VTLYDASAEPRTGLPLAAVPTAEVEVRPEWLVAEVLQAGGYGGYNSFALVTPDIEADVAGGEDRTVDAWDLFGIDDQGAIKYQGKDHIRWAEFLRAHEAALYEGDPTRIVVYPYGAAGGPSPDGLWEIVQWLSENRDLAVDQVQNLVTVAVGMGLEAGRQWITSARRRQIARKWREQGFTAPRIRDYLARCPQWDPSQFAKQTQLTELEARLALTKAGYEEGADGLWRLSNSVEGSERRKVMEEIEKRAEANIEEGWRSDDFRIDEEETASEDGGERGFGSDAG
jgi:DNA-binding transcriptional MerR regulator